MALSKARHCWTDGRTEAAGGAPQSLRGNRHLLLSMAPRGAGAAPGVTPGQEAAKDTDHKPRSSALRNTDQPP